MFFLSFFLSFFLFLIFFHFLFVSIFPSVIYFLFYVILSLFLFLFIFNAFFLPSIAFQWVARLLLIREAPGSNIGPETEYPEALRSIPQYPQYIIHLSTSYSTLSRL
jgi:hypothetical protein